MAIDDLELTVAAAYMRDRQDLARMIRLARLSQQAAAAEGSAQPGLLDRVRSLFSHKPAVSSKAAA